MISSLEVERVPLDHKEDGTVLEEVDAVHLDSTRLRSCWPRKSRAKKKIWSKKQRFETTTSHKSLGQNILAIDQLELVTRCGGCGQRGHWHKECTNPDKQSLNSK